MNQQATPSGQERVGRAPVIVTVSDLRRDTARLIERICRSGEPLFVTQRGYATAVLLSRGEFDTMCILRDRGLRCINPRAFIDERRCDTEDTDTTAPGYWNEVSPEELD
jgi:prevent-host-death family protein